MNPSSSNLDPSFRPESHLELTGMTIVDRYFVEKVLGHGGVGAVYLARDHKLHDKPVVVKVLLDASLRDEWVVQKFLQEKEALARVDHPGVVGILDTGELPDGKPYIVMQYVDGMSLREAIEERQEGLDLARVASIVRQIGAALSAVHQKRVFHRDLKPENIMVQVLSRGEEHVKIVDFGIAKIKGSVIAPSTVTGSHTAGTIAYMSPEQLLGEKVGAASDIYSFGVIAYELITGRRPFNPETVAQLSQMQREGVRVKPSDLRPRLSKEGQAIILRALSFDPRDRYENASEFAVALANALTDEEAIETLPDPRADKLPATILSNSSSVPEKTLTSLLEPPKFRSQEQVSQGNARRPTFLLKLAAGLIVIIALSVVGYWLINRRSAVVRDEVKPNSSSQRSLVYSLTVQKMRDDKPYQEPFESSGQEIFENGYKFRLNVWSPQSGFLYVFNEGPDEKTGTIFTIIYPTPATNRGSAELIANQAIQTNWNRFSGEAGTEQFWIISSSTQVRELEDAKESAFKHDEGEIKGAEVISKLKSFLVHPSNSKPVTTKDTAKQQTDVRANGDLLIKLIELEHR